MLKTWYDRKPSDETIKLATLAFIPMSKEEEIEEKEANIEYLINKSTQSFKDIKLDENLTPIQKADIRHILSRFQNTNRYTRQN